MKYFIVDAFIKWNLNENYQKITFHYKTKKDQERGHDKIASDCLRLLSAGKLVDYRVESK